MEKQIKEIREYLFHEYCTKNRKWNYDRTPECEELRTSEFGVIFRFTGKCSFKENLVSETKYGILELYTEDDRLDISRIKNLLKGSGVALLVDGEFVEYE